MMSKLPLIKQQQVRDLAWSCFGPNLIDNFQILKANCSADSCCFQFNRTRQQWLKQLERNPAPLLEHLSKFKSTRLGIYFEALWQFFIEQDPSLEMVAANLPVYQDKKTLGEFDIIFYNRELNKHIHLELAIKFYLNNETSDNNNGLQRWLGPNCRDRLDLKVSHLLNHQVMLSENPAAKAQLKRMHIEQIVRQIALKGFLFIPGSGNSPLKQPYSNTLSSNLIFHHWYHFAEFKKQVLLHQYWHILAHQHWISPAFIPLENGSKAILDSPQLLDQLAGHFSGRGNPMMVCLMKKTEDGFIELKRAFVTANNWPQTALINGS